MLAPLLSYLCFVQFSTAGASPSPLPDGPMNTYTRPDCKDNDKNWVLTNGKKIDECSILRKQKQMTTKCCPDEGHVAVLQPSEKTSKCTKIEPDQVSVCGTQTCPSTYINKLEKDMTEDLTTLNGSTAVNETNQCVLGMCYPKERDLNRIHVKTKTDQSANTMPRLTVKYGPKLEDITSNSILVIDKAINDTGKLKFELSVSQAVVATPKIEFTISTETEELLTTDQTDQTEKTVSLDLKFLEHQAPHLSTVLRITANITKTDSDDELLVLQSTIFVFNLVELEHMWNTAAAIIKDLVRAYQSADTTKVNCDIEGEQTPWDTGTEPSGFLIRPKFTPKSIEENVTVAACSYTLTLAITRCFPNQDYSIIENKFKDIENTVSDLAILPLPSTAISTSEAPASKDGLKMIHFVIIGCAGGGFLILLIILIIILWYCCRKKDTKKDKKKEHKSDKQSEKSKSFKESGKEMKKLKEVIVVDKPIEDFDNINMKEILPAHIYDKAVKDKVPLNLVLKVRKKKGSS